MLAMLPQPCSISDMGISGHILGENKLRRLRRETGIDFDRAFNRNGSGGGRVVSGGECIAHYSIDFRTFAVERNAEPQHWWSCHHINEEPAE